MRRSQWHRISVAQRARPGAATQSGQARRRLAVGCAGLLALALAAGGCGTHAKPSTGTTPVNGGTVTYALPANVTPNYIFPFVPTTFYTITNLDNLQYLMYRPLYWFGNNGLPYLNEQLSLAYLPTYHGQVVTIKLKPNLHWSNGALMTAKDVMFWMNMMKALAKKDFGGYVPGDLPDDVRNIHAVGTDEVQMTIVGKYSSLWFTDNDLSQISPLPQYWDRTGPSTPSDCADQSADCAAVFKYLNGVSSDTSTWATSPLWRIVDGPWKLTSYNTQGVLTFSYNRRYSLPVPKDHVTVFQEIPFTSEEAEFNQLQAGGSSPIDVGYLPTVDAPVPAPGMEIGQNPVNGYRMQPVYTWGLSYMPFNFNPADPQVAIFRQRYFRRALQLLVNQAAIIQGALHGYGVVSTGPVGDAPPTKYLSPIARKGDPFPYSLGEARSLLRSHGWNVRSGGLTTCVDPGRGSGQCGPGVKANAKLDFKMLYATGNAWVQAAVLQLKSNAALVGIQMSVSGESFDNVIITTSPAGCGPAAAPVPCPWELADWGEGWSYVPDYLPTGDEVFGKGSFGNIGEYSDPTNDTLIKRTLQTSSLSAMYRWEDYLTQQLPVLLQPTAPAALVESIDSLRIGVQSPTLALTPEDWYFVR
jgi:peptide/nickel transport system substrate-binding protein